MAQCHLHVYIFNADHLVLDTNWCVGMLFPGEDFLFSSQCSSVPCSSLCGVDASWAFLFPWWHVYWVVLVQLMFRHPCRWDSVGGASDGPTPQQIPWSSGSFFPLFCNDPQASGTGFQKKDTLMGLGRWPISNVLVPQVWPPDFGSECPHKCSMKCWVSVTTLLRVVIGVGTVGSLEFNGQPT